MPDAVRVVSAARQLVAAVVRRSPAPVARWIRALVERVAYRMTPVIHDLPPIFHYWSNTYLRPELEALGFVSPEDFYFVVARDRALETGGAIRCLSIASGRCETEIGLAGRLRAAGVRVQFTCLEMNRRLLDDARRLCREAGLDDCFHFECVDLGRNEGRIEPVHDFVMANQCLHHFQELEAALDFVSGALAADGVFATCDVIGRNGHQLWPEARVEVERIWATLPKRLRRDRTRGGSAATYRDYDHSNVGFEGIRAQDVLPLLVERFHFERFAPSACLVLPFIERRFGWNFDAEDAADRALIDDIARRDLQLLHEGVLKPTQLIAAMRKRPVPQLSTRFPFTPAECIRWPD